MNIITLVAAERGVRCLERIGTFLSNKDTLTVFTFNEAEWEPPFCKKIESTCQSLNGSFFNTTKVHDEQYTHIWESKPDIIIVIGWRYLIPSLVYDSARIGCFVFHDSYLPYYRGFGPSVWAVRNGEEYTGATLFKIVEEMDAGAIVTQRKVFIDDTDYIKDVVNNVTETYLDIIEDVMPNLIVDKLKLTEQNHLKATFTCKSMPQDFKINWKDSANNIRNLIRSYSPPYSGSFCFLNGEKLTILTADINKEQNLSLIHI